ncbi:glucokinase [Paracoccus sp. (in: a-proteobacteria)]|uniref:glucokinase n=1 Tax=Paracoccus sp. TaxID=267 RepID=UPI003220723E
MAILLADVGGTNARLALARDGVLDPASIARFRGEDHPDFDRVLRLYLDARGRPGIEAACVAVAGPVRAGSARLTNRDWSFSEPRLAALTGAGRALLINDMIALGHAAAALPEADAGFLRPPPPGAAGNGQRLVVNAGTGFNVCPVRLMPGGAAICLEAEDGHTRLPLPLAALLGEIAAGFDSVEELFAGRGLARLHALRSGQAPGDARVVTEAAARGDASAEASCTLQARLLGLYCRELALRFMPLAGIFLAGSVARACAGRFAAFEAGLLQDPLMAGIVHAVPVAVIGDDLAALHGCLAALA